jgi:membrane protein DedA with SNARE-associated domain
MSSILATLSHFIINTISSLGYGGVSLLMAIGAFNIPLPSEVILPFSGYLVSTGRFSLPLVAIFASGGWLVGATFSYWLGYSGGRPFAEKYGKYLLISKRDLDHAEKWFGKFGEVTVLIGQVLPVVRNFISITSGISKLKFGKFLAFSFIGAFVWAYLLTWFGLKLGQNWVNLRDYFKNFDILIVALIVLAIVLWIWRHLRRPKD